MLQDCRFRNGKRLAEHHVHARGWHGAYVFSVCSRVNTWNRYLEIHLQCSYYLEFVRNFLYFHASNE
jgi:hypothetical protein